MTPRSIAELQFDTRPPDAWTLARANAPQATPSATVQELGWWMPLVLFVAGWITFLFRNSNTAFEIGMAGGSIVACRSVFLMLFKCKDFRFSWMIGCGQLLGYAVGSLNTALQLVKQHQTIADHFFRPQDDLSMALSLVLWISACLFLVGGLLEKPVRLDPSKLLKTDISYLYIALLIYFGALATHQVGYMGTSVSDEGHVTVLGTLAGMVACTIPAMTVLLRNKSRLLRKNLVFWLLLLVELAALLPSGRRMIIYSLLCLIFTFSLVGVRWRSSLWRKVLILTVCGVGFYGANLVFYAMRHVAEESGAAKRMGAPDMSLSEIVTGALKFLQKGRDSSFDQEMAGNLQDRTFVLRYFSELVAQSWTHKPLHGGIVLFGIQMATPSSIYSLFGSKDKVIALGMEEIVANPDFGLKAQDEANSYLTGGVSDFGVVGAFVYPIVIALVINFGVRIGLSRAPELMRCLAMLMLISALFQTEFAVTGMIVFLRNIAFLVIGWIPVSAVLRFFMKSSSRVPNQPNGRRYLAGPGATLVRYEALPRRH